MSKAPVGNNPYLLNDLSDSPYMYYDGHEWGQAFTFSCDSLPDDIEALSVIAQIHNDEELSQCVIVIELHDTETDSLMLWHSSLPEDGHFLSGDNVVVDAIVFNDGLNPKGKTVKTFLWNQGKQPLVVNKLSYYTTRKSKVLKGLYDPLN